MFVILFSFSLNETKVLEKNQFERWNNANYRLKLSRIILWPQCELFDRTFAAFAFTSNRIDIFSDEHLVFFSFFTESLFSFKRRSLLLHTATELYDKYSWISIMITAEINNRTAIYELSDILCDYKTHPRATTITTTTTTATQTPTMDHQSPKDLNWTNNHLAKRAIEIHPLIMTLLVKCSSEIVYHAHRAKNNSFKFRPELWQKTTRNTKRTD